MYTVERLSVMSSDGTHNLAGIVYKPKCAVKALFHLVHGMTEYIERYDHLLSFLANEGFLSFGFDNLGHGKTAKDDEELGFIASKNGYEFLVDDVGVFEAQIRKDYPDLPLFLMGHSMGSFIVRLAATKHDLGLSGLIICGTGGPLAVTPLGLALTDILRKIYGERHFSDFAENIAFGAYNKRFEGVSKYDWLTNKREVIETYEKDRLCTFRFTVSAMHDLIKLNALSNSKEWFKNYSFSLPTFIISGALDPVGNYGKGVKAVYENLLKGNRKNIECKLYENCRHEIHNDICQEEMFRDISAFLARNI